MPTQIIWGLLVIIAFVIVGGSKALYDLRWEPLPNRLRWWLLRHVGPPRWHVWIAMPPRAQDRWTRYTDKYVMSRAETMTQADRAGSAAGATTGATVQQPIAIAQNESNESLLVARMDALAALVIAGKIGETEGIKLIEGVSPSSKNKHYLAARDALHAAMRRRQPAKYPPLNNKQKAFRKSMGLSVS